MVSRLPEGLDATALDEFFKAAEDAADRVGVGFMFALLGDDDLPRVVHASPGICELLGRPLEALRDTNPWDLTPAEDRERLEDLVQRRNQGESGPARLRLHLVKRSGERVPVEIGTTRLSFRGKRYILLFLQNIEERVRAAEELERSERRFRSVVENAPDGVAILRDGRIVYLNPTATRLLNFERMEDALGLEIASLMIPSDRGKASTRIQQTVETGRPLGNATEYRVPSPDGGVRTCEVVSIPIEFEGAPAVIGFARDVTERTAMQENLVRADRLATIGTLAATVAHEINNPLAYVQMSLEHLEQQIAELGLAADRVAPLVEGISEARQGVSRVETIVKNLRSSMRAEEEPRGPVDVTATLERAIRLCENELRHRARLVRSFQSVPPVFATASRLEQVFLNLLVNAGQSFQGSDLERNRIDVRIDRAADGMILVEVSDTGAGMSSDVLAHAFDPFFTTKPSGIGTGLGLPICKQLVEDLGGRLEAESEPSRGSTFRVFLRPLADGERRLNRKTPLPYHVAKRQRVLLVDDEPLIRTLFQKLVDRLHDVTTAASPHEALRILEESEPFAAIFCDLMMPGVNGMQLFEEIGQRWPGLEQRMVFITGGVFDETLAQFLSDVPNPKLFKPFQLTEVLNAVDEVIG